MVRGGNNHIYAYEVNGNEITTYGTISGKRIESFDQVSEYLEEYIYLLDDCGAINLKETNLTIDDLLKVKDGLSFDLLTNKKVILKSMTNELEEKKKETESKINLLSFLSFLIAGIIIFCTIKSSATFHSLILNCACAFSMYINFLEPKVFYKDIFKLKDKIEKFEIEVQEAEKEHQKKEKEKELIESLNKNSLNAVLKRVEKENSLSELFTYVDNLSELYNLNPELANYVGIKGITGKPDEIIFVDDLINGKDINIKKLKNNGN